MCSMRHERTVICGRVCVSALIVVAQHEATPPAALKRGAAGQDTEKRARSLSPLLSHHMSEANP